MQSKFKTVVFKIHWCSKITINFCKIVIKSVFTPHNYNKICNIEIIGAGGKGGNYFKCTSYHHMTRETLKKISDHLYNIQRVCCNNAAAIIEKNSLADFILVQSGNINFHKFSAKQLHKFIQWERGLISVRAVPSKSRRLVAVDVGRGLAVVMWTSITSLVSSGFVWVFTSPAAMTSREWEMSHYSKIILSSTISVIV